eukprot:66669-Pelagomonas_calceolata.AAC.1
MRGRIQNGALTKSCLDCIFMLGSNLQSQERNLGIHVSIITMDIWTVMYPITVIETLDATSKERQSDPLNGHHSVKSLLYQIRMKAMHLHVLIFKRGIREKAVWRMRKFEEEVLALQPHAFMGEWNRASQI